MLRARSRCRASSERVPRRRRAQALPRLCKGAGRNDGHERAGRHWAGDEAGSHVGVEVRESVLDSLALDGVVLQPAELGDAVAVQVRLVPAKRARIAAMGAAASA